jgi:hypothetical protein
METIFRVTVAHHFASLKTVADTCQTTKIERLLVLSSPVATEWWMPNMKDAMTVTCEMETGAPHFVKLSHFAIALAWVAGVAGMVL